MENGPDFGPYEKDPNLIEMVRLRPYWTEMVWFSLVRSNLDLVWVRYCSRGFNITKSLKGSQFYLCYGMVPYRLVTGMGFSTNLAILVYKTRWAYISSLGMLRPIFCPTLTIFGLGAD